MDSKSTIELKPGVRIRPGELIADQEILDAYDRFIGKAAHIHCFDSANGYVIGTSMWWRLHGKEMKQTVNIRGLFCECGCMLMLDGDK